MINIVIKLRNDMVMVFDADGEQIPEYQGQFEDVKTSILRDAPQEAIFACWFNHDPMPEIIFREGW